jgi:hypothetical protein
MLGAACAPGDRPDACPSWTRADGDRCVLRAWSRPEVDDALSEPGAREVQAAIGPDADPVLAWSTNDATAGVVVVAEPERDAFAGERVAWSTRELARDEGVGLEPAIAVGAGGQAIAAWKQQADTGAIWLAHRTAPGQWRIDDAPISWAETAYEPRVAFTRDDETIALWNQWTGANFSPAVARRGPGEATFVVPDGVDELLAAPVNYSNAPRIAVAPSGAALVTWYQAPVDDLMVYVSERPSAEAPFEPAAAEAFVSAKGAPVDSHVEANPQPAITDDAAAVVWTQVHGEPWDIAVYLARRDGPVSAGNPWRGPTSLGDTLSEPGAFARCPSLGFAGDGELFVTWYESRDDDTAVMVWRDDGGAPLRLSTPDRVAVHPVLAIAADGGAVIVWAQSSVDAPDTWQVVTRRWQRDADEWLAEEPLSIPQAGLAPTPQIAIDLEGAVLVAWAQGGVIDGRVYAATMPR